MPSRPHGETKPPGNGTGQSAETRAARAQRFFFGDDIFVSYSRHNSDYALALADQLTKKKLSCFLDQWGTPADEELPQELVERLRKSTTLIIVGTEQAARSENVLKELLEFKQTRRPIIPITFVGQGDFARIQNNDIPEDLKGTLGEAAWYNEIAGIALTVESEERLKADGAGKPIGPSPEVITRVVNAVSFLSRNRRLRRTFWATLATILVLLLTTGLITYALVEKARREAQKAADMQARAEAKAAEAEGNRCTADDLRAQADEKRGEAEAATRKAQGDLRVAEGKVKKAAADLAAANRQTQDAQAKAATARVQQAEAERLKRQAVIQRVAASAQEAAAKQPALGVLLAERAEGAAGARGLRILSAENALRGTLAGISGDTVAGSDRERLGKAKPVFSPNGRWLVAHSPDFMAVCDSTADRLKWKTLSLPAPPANADETSDRCSDPTFSPEGERLARNCGGVVYIWDLRADQDSIAPAPLPPEVRAEEALNSAEARWLVNAGLLSPPDPRALLSRLGGAAAQLPPAGERESYQFSDDWRWLAHTDGATAVSLYDLKGASPSKPLKVIAGAYNGVQIEGRWLVLSDEYGNRKYLDLRTADSGAEPFTLPGLKSSDSKTEAEFDKETFIYSPDGRWLAYFEGEKKVVMYDLTAKPAPKLYPLAEVSDTSMYTQTTGISFSPGGHWFALTTPEGLTFWEMSDAGPKNAHAERQGSPSEDSAVFSDDEQWLLWVRSNGYMQLRRLLPEGTEVAPGEQTVFDLSVDAAQSMWPQFSRGSRWLFVDIGRAINVWDLRHPEQPPLELRGSEQVGLPVFSADGHHAATISDDGIARVWELESLQASTQPQVFRPEDDQGYQLLSPDHRWLLTRAMGGASHLWDMSAERPWGHPVTLTDKEGRWLSSSDNARLPFSPDGRWLITSRGENVAQVWDLTTVKTDPRPFEIKLDKSAIDFSPDSRLLVAACADGVTRVWNLPFNKSHKPAFELPRRPSPDAALFFGNVSRLLVAVSRDESRLFDLSQGAPTPQSGIQLVAFPRPPSSPSNRFADTSREKPLFSPDDRWLAALDGQDVRLWDLSAGPPSRPALSVSHPGSEGGHIEMKFSHKGGWLLTRVGKGGKLLRLTREPPGVGVTQISYWLYEAFSPDDRWLFVKDVNKAPELWELSETPHAARSLEEARIFSRGDYVFSPDSHWLMVNGSSDPSATEKDLLIWDLRDPTLTRRKMPKTAISGMPFSPNSRWLVTYRSNLKAPASTAFWDLSLQSPFEKPGFELGPTGGIVFSPDAKWAASADSTEHYVALWDLSEAPTQTEPLLLPSAELNDYSGGVRINLRLLFDTDHLYVLGSEILRWELDAGRLRLLARRAAGRELNEMERLRYLQDFESDEGAAARGPGKSRPGARH